MDLWVAWGDGVWMSVFCWVLWYWLIIDNRINYTLIRYKSMRDLVTQFGMWYFICACGCKFILCWEVCPGVIVYIRSISQTKTSATTAERETDACGAKFRLTGIKGDSPVPYAELGHFFVIIRVPQLAHLVTVSPSRTGVLAAFFLRKQVFKPRFVFIRHCFQRRLTTLHHTAVWFCLGYNVRMNLKL